MDARLISCLDEGQLTFGNRGKVIWTGEGAERSIVSNSPAQSGPYPLLFGWGYGQARLL